MISFACAVGFRVWELPTLRSSLSAGNTRSMVLGRGMEYEESRQYAASDDVRMIDWRVTAAYWSGAHTKVFREDRQRAVYLVVDMTESMRFGTRSAFKSVVAAEAAAIFAWTALAQGDVVHVIGVSETGSTLSRPARTTGGVIRQLKYAI